MLRLLSPPSSQLPSKNCRSSFIIYPFKWEKNVHVHINDSTGERESGGREKSRKTKLIKASDSPYHYTEFSMDIAA